MFSIGSVALLAFFVAQITSVIGYVLLQRTLPGWVVAALMANACLWLALQVISWFIPDRDP
ncbi:hypothetical protein LBMAG53_35980 [Planctomycetota bacterium]|nr:hypothetical protein LBMAG53_35980 [Planctomycetota bacterium]